MSSANSPKSLKAFIKSKVNDNPLFPFNKTKLINNLVQAIENERIININGAAGTGKTYLVNNVIIPQMVEKYSYHRFNSKDFKSIDLGNILLDPYNKIIIITKDIMATSGNNNIDANEIDRILNIIDDGYDISLLSLQEQFLDYPTIIEKIINDIHNITMDQIQVSLVGYLESIISGIKSNILGLKKIIKSEDTAKWQEQLKLCDPSVKFMLTLSSYLDSKRKRENIWDSIYHVPRAVDLIEINNFNERLRKSWSLAVADSGLAPGRIHTKAIDLMRIKKYCTSILSKFTYNKIDKKSIEELFKPLNKKINGLQSGENISQTIIENIYIFNKSETKQKLIPATEAEPSSVYIKTYNKLEIKKFRDFHDKLQISIQLKSESDRAPKINIHLRAASFLIFLAIERINKESGWLKEPLKHKDVLLTIMSKLELATGTMQDEIPLKAPITWIYDKENKIRKKIVHEINEKLIDRMDPTAYLFNKNQKQSGINGVYSLINSIKQIKLPW